MDCKSKLKPTRCTISKQQTWFKFTLPSSNQRRCYSDSQTCGGCFANTLLPGAHLRTKQLQACCAHFPGSSFDQSSSSWI